MDNKISFIGVGPGDPELLTLKALKKIKIADVIIWTDSLIPEKILDFSKEDSEKICFILFIKGKNKDDEN